MNKKEFIFIIFTHQLISYSEVIAEDGCSIRVMVLQIQKFMLVAMINLIFFLCWFLKMLNRIMENVNMQTLGFLACFQNHAWQFKV